MAWFPITVAIILGAILIGEIAMVPILTTVDGHSGAGHNSSVIKLSSYVDPSTTTAPPPTTSAPTPAPPSPSS